MITEEDRATLPMHTIEQILLLRNSTDPEFHESLKFIQQEARETADPEDPRYDKFYMLNAQCRNCWAEGPQLVISATATTETLNNLECLECGAEEQEVTLLTTCRSIRNKK